MSEVLARRYAPERMADERFGTRPDLLILDGGKPQLTAAIEQLGELGLDIPVAGLAKSDEGTVRAVGRDARGAAEWLCLALSREARA